MTQTIMMYGALWCSDCQRAKAFFEDHNIDYTWIDITDNDDAIARVEALNNGNRSIPTILFPDGDIMVEPSNAELASKLDINAQAKNRKYDVIVIGGGPAGLSAAMYATREGLSTLVIEKSGFGGQLNNTEVLDNFPGFEDGIAGEALATRFTAHAERFGAELLNAQAVEDIYRGEDGWLHIITHSNDDYMAKAVLIATGTQYRHLNIDGEAELIGKQIHFCATCDGAFYRDKDVLVIGGGNSGFEEGLFLTKFAKQVTIVEFLPEVKASQVLQDEVAARDDMRVITNHAVKSFSLKPNGKLDVVAVENRATGEIEQWQPDGVFVFIGLTPNTGFLPKSIATNEWGFITTDEKLQTSLAGVFAAGDVRAGSTKQAVSAAGEGSTTALNMREYITKQTKQISEKSIAVGD